ncbi:unnamed protein product [Aphanomyces euteiches]
MAVYDALDVKTSSDIYFWMGVLGSLAHLITILSYLVFPQLKKQHPSANLMIWHVFCNWMLSLGFVVQYFVQGDKGMSDEGCAPFSVFNQFFILGSSLWYMMLSLDLLVALINPWMGYAIKTWAYHIITWSFSSLSAASVYSLRLYGLSALNICWLHRTADVRETNESNWVMLFGPLLAVWFVSFAVLLFATFRFARRQMDSTYRAKRRSLLQYFRYLIMYGVFWVVCGALYYSDYLHAFSGRTAQRLQIAFALVFGSYPVLIFLVWSVNTELLSHLHGSVATDATSHESSSDMTDHFSTSLRKDLMRYTTVGIVRSLREAVEDSPVRRSEKARSDPNINTRPARALSWSGVSVRSDEFLEDGGGDTKSFWYHEKKRLATTVRLSTSKLKVYYEKLGFTDYAPRVFANLRVLAGIDPIAYETSFVGTLSEIASEGKSGMLFYFTSDKKYIVKTMTKDEHSFLMRILPSYHSYIRAQPSTLLCRFLGCHSMQLPVGWDKMFFVVMENVLSTHNRIEERYDLKGLFAPVLQPPLRVFIRDPPTHTTRLLSPPPPASSSSSEYPTELWHDQEFIARGTYLNVSSDTRLQLLTQMTHDAGFLQEMGIMDYSCILGIRSFDPSRETLESLPKNAIVAADQSVVYYLGNCLSPEVKLNRNIS